MIFQNYLNIRISIKEFKKCGKYANNNIRISFHPDQFVVLNSPDPEIVKRSIAELEYQTEVAEWLGADVINIHGGGAYGDKPLAYPDLLKI